MNYMPITAAAAALGVPSATLERSIRFGLVPVLRVGRIRVIDVDECSWIAALERDDPLVGISECSRRTGLAVSTIRRMAYSGQVPYWQPGTKLFFRMGDVTEALRKLERQDQK